MKCSDGAYVYRLGSNFNVICNSLYQIKYYTINNSGRHRVTKFTPRTALQFLPFNLLQTREAIWPLLFCFSVDSRIVNISKRESTDGKPLQPQNNADKCKKTLTNTYLRDPDWIKSATRVLANTMFPLNRLDRWFGRLIYHRQGLLISGPDIPMGNNTTC
jgi:hypothetical protein